MTLEALAAAMRAVTSEQPQPVPLRYVVDLHKVLPLLEDEAVRERLLPLLPEEQRTAQGLKDTVSRLRGCGAVTCCCAQGAML